VPVRATRFAIISGFLWLAGCGYVGPVMPPSPQIPAAVTDLAALQRGDKIEISFHTPPRTTDRVGIRKFSAIDLRLGPEAVSLDSDTWATVAKPYAINPPLPGDPLDPKPLPLSTSVPIQGWQGKKVAIALRSSIKAGDDHFSAWSNRVVLDIVEPVPPPANFKIASSADGVTLDWSAVDAADGYRILRQAPGDRTSTEVGKTKAAHFVDATSQFDVPYSYQVVALNAGAESLPSAPLQITPADKFAPSIPAGITALPGPDSIEVSWQRSPEADTAGYYVYRSVDGAAFDRVGDIVNLPAFSDRKVEHGKTYRYQISSIDQKSNESGKSPPVEVSF
jgi:hypothetical protein